MKKALVSLAITIVLSITLFSCSKSDYIAKESSLVISDAATDTARPIKYFRLYIPAIKTAEPYRIASNRKR